MATTYYPFGQTADRLIQIAVREDGCIQITKRARDAAGGWSSPAGAPNTPAPGTNPFLAPKNRTSPIEFTLSVNENCWALAAAGPPEWDLYRYSSAYILGQAGPNPEPFGPAELDYGTGYRNPAPTVFTRSLHFVVNGSMVEFADPVAPKGSQKTVIDTSLWYSKDPNQNRACFVLRVCGANKGSATFINVDVPGGNAVSL